MDDPVQLRDVLPSDLPIFFEQQRDPDARYQAAFTSEDPNNREVFDQHWSRILADPDIVGRTILFEDQVAGNVLSFLRGEEREVCYWIGRDFWGKGIATQALAAFLSKLSERPLVARVAKHNHASIRVLEKCGFKVVGSESGFAHGCGEVIEEWKVVLMVPGA